MSDGNPLEYTLSGAGPFAIDQFSGQITVTGPLTLGEHTVAVATTDGRGGTDQVDVVITVSLLGPSPAAPVAGGGGGGGPTPSEVDFEWTVRHDIDELAGGHDTPSGLWSDGATLWLAENGDGAGDAADRQERGTALGGSCAVRGPGNILDQLPSRHRRHGVPSADL